MMDRERGEKTGQKVALSVTRGRWISAGAGKPHLQRGAGTLTEGKWYGYARKAFKVAKGGGIY